MRDFLENTAVGFLAGFIIIGILLAFASEFLWDEGYRNGQLDIQRGIVRYELDERVDKGWIKLKEVGDETE